MSSMKPAHPGLVLQDELEELGISQSALAHNLGVDSARINDICAGRRGISPDMAMKLDRALGGTQKFWMNLQVQWELSKQNNKKYRSIRRMVGKRAA